MAAVTFTLTLRTHGEDAHRRLRRALKTMLRRDQLKAIDVRECTAKVSRCSTARVARMVKTTQGRRESETKMKMSKYAGSSFISYDDVEGGKFSGTIAMVEPGQYDKAVITFSSGQRFSLNVTNTQTLIKAWGDESKDWLGEKAELYAGTVKFKGEDQPSVLVRPLMRAKGEKKVVPPKPMKGGPIGDMDAVDNSMDDEIPYR